MQVPTQKRRQIHLLKGKESWEGNSKQRVYGWTLAELLPKKKRVPLCFLRDQIDMKNTKASPSGHLSLIFNWYFCLINLFDISPFWSRRFSEIIDQESHLPLLRDCFPSMPRRISVPQWKENVQIRNLLISLPPCWLNSKTSALNVGDWGPIPELGRSPGERNGNPLQYSCLKTPMNGGAWCAIVHGETKSQTRLSDFTLTFK